MFLILNTPDLDPVEELMYFGECPKKSQVIGGNKQLVPHLKAVTLTFKLQPIICQNDHRNMHATSCKYDQPYTDTV